MAVEADRLVDIMNDLSMIIIGDFNHLEDSPGQFVEVPWLFLGLAELLEGHGAAMIGRADAELDDRHGRFLLWRRKPGWPPSPDLRRSRRCACASKDYTGEALMRSRSRTA